MRKARFTVLDQLTSRQLAQASRSPGQHPRHVATQRRSGEHRRYRESILLKVQYITLAQRAGFNLEEIAEQLATLPERLPPPRKLWEPLSELWFKRIDERIAELEQLKVDIANCKCA